MKPKSERSIELYNMMLRRGYPEPFCDDVTKNLNTDWTAQRMIGYLSHYKKLPMEEVADEMLALLNRKLVLGALSLFDDEYPIAISLDNKYFYWLKDLQIGK
jgi:hypothetical protein